MKPFIVLLLCCSFFCSRAIPLPYEFSDCDDPDVFKAVDAALQKYNGDRATGNQFALYVVMEAKRTPGPDPQFYMKYRILETSCAIEENKPWQHCHYKPSAEAQTGECTARVHMNDAEKTSNVSQECKIFSDVSKIRVTQVTCLGCYHPISADSSQVSEILNKAVQKFNKHSDEPALFKLVEIKQAKRQVVAGWNYIIEYEIEETNCSKEQFSDLTPECRTTSRGHVGKCEAKAYQNLQAEIADIRTECKLQAEEPAHPAICPGCPQTISRTSPELQNLLEVSMEKYNSESNYDFHYKHGEVQSATIQVVAGTNYNIKFRAWKTNCSKSEFEKLNEDCEATSDSASLSCEAQIYVVPWQNKTTPTIKCSEERTVVTNVAIMAMSFRNFLQEGLLDSHLSGVLYTPPLQKTIRVLAKNQRKMLDRNQKAKVNLSTNRGINTGRDVKRMMSLTKGMGTKLVEGAEVAMGVGIKKHSKNGKHEHPKPKSSGESSERGFNQNKTVPSSSAETAPELVSPGIARQETSSPAEPLILPDTSLFNGLPDHPEPLHPRCPGKPWKQIMDLPDPPSLPTEFTNEDLLPSAAENIDSATADEEKDFDLADALQ